MLLQNAYKLNSCFNIVGIFFASIPFSGVFYIQFFMPEIMFFFHSQQKRYITDYLRDSKLRGINLKVK